jgi:hypothetical protein
MLDVTMRTIDDAHANTALKEEAVALLLLTLQVAKLASFLAGSLAPLVLGAAVARSAICH